ncbi:sensor domain-containing diguanylate cyclase [Teredinibacter turnerae]|uniref:GGDEF domain-containing protein n=1 Tax=Teredinibacter turnerae TaxID=2426 RepID=UPI000361B0C9|nr:diguanylate cyclase [Teredinibacter turnerae]
MIFHHALECDANPVFRWDKNLETGIDIIDEQHQRLVALTNRLAHCLLVGSPAEADHIYADLADYAGYHFATEEAIWEKYLAGDAWFSAHQREHANFIPSLTKLCGRDENLDADQAIERTFRFLVRWLLCHILEDDKKLADAVLAIQSGLDPKAAKALAKSRANNLLTVFVDTLLNMHSQLASRTLALLRERAQRNDIQNKLEATNRELVNLAITDQLTGLFNRRHFDTVLQREINRARRQRNFLTLIYLDIDDFKKLNDTYGHAQGDLALQAVAKVITESSRRSADFAFRVGGEEFAVLLANTQLADAEIYAERLRLAVLAREIPNETARAAPLVTLSLGVFTHLPSAGDTQDLFLGQADARLYAAKSQGRNRWISRLP